MMREGFTPARFGPPDPEGFRAVSFYGADGAEVLRLSLHMERFHQQLTSSASNLEQYSNDEQEGLRTAAVLAAARKKSSLHDPDLVLAAILDLLIPKFVTDQTEEHFPTLAWIALQAVSDACVKYAISGVVESMHAPRIYDAEAADLVLRPLTETIRKEFLRIKAGRPAEVRKHMEETREAVRQLVEKGELRAGDRPTEEQLAEKIGIDERLLRNWPGTCNLTWDEWLTASQYKNVQKAEVPYEWLTACSQLENAEKGEKN